MFSRASLQFTPVCTQVRGMATLKALSMRLKAVKNIQKITKSMKMVSAAKYARAEKDLKPARVYGQGSLAFFEKAEVAQDAKKPVHLMIALTSDRGLCGGVHSAVSKAIRAKVPDVIKDGADVQIICIGDKSRGVLSRFFRDKIFMHFVEFGKKPPTFTDASIVANAIMASGLEFDVGYLFYNVFKTVVTYKTTEMPVYRRDDLANAKKISLYDSIDDDVLQSFQEFTFASQLYFAMKENACSEQSQRMTAMDGATKNAGEMIEKLTLTYNRTRQSVITRELIEIISGAAALK